MPRRPWRPGKVVGVTSQSPVPTVGQLVRRGRTRRRLSHLAPGHGRGDLDPALELRRDGTVAPEHLDIPLRERNSLLLAGGYAPAYPMSTFGETPKSAVSQAIGRILDGHEPYPALVVDRHW